jgi:hypothetical protein
MGADLLITAVELRETKAQCLQRINNLDWSDLDAMQGKYENAGIWIDEDISLGDPQTLAKWMKERLEQAVDTVYAERGSRHVNTLCVDGVNKYIITGGMSWGDEPSDEWDCFNLFNELLGYPYWAKPNSKQRKEWERLGRNKKRKANKPKVAKR